MCVSDRERAFAQEGERHTWLAAPLEGEGGADRHRGEVAEHRDEREDAARGRAEMHVAVPSAGGSVAAAEEVAERIRDRDAPREVAGELAVERADDVAVQQRETRAGRDGLLSAPVVERAGDAALPVERQRALLEQPLEQDEPVELEPRVEHDERERRRTAQ